MIVKIAVAAIASIKVTPEARLRRPALRIRISLLLEITSVFLHNISCLDHLKSSFYSFNQHTFVQYAVIQQIFVECPGLRYAQTCAWPTQPPPQVL